MPPRPSSYNVLASSDGGATRRPFYSAVQSSNVMVAPPPPLQVQVQAHEDEDDYDSSDWFDPPDAKDANNWRNGGMNHDAREGS